MDDQANEAILEVCRTLRMENPLRKQVMAVIANPEALIRDARPILSALTTTSLFWDWKAERTVACWLIVHGTWSEEQRLSLSKTLLDSVAKMMQQRKPARIVLRLLRNTVIAASPFVLFLPWYDAMSDALILLGSLSICLPIYLATEGRNLDQFQTVLEALGTVGQPDSIVSLLAASQNMTLGEAATSALLNVLSRLTPDDYGTLPLQAVPTLCRALTNRTPPQTLLIILEVLSVIGDGRAISAVEDLAMRAVDTDVYEAAAKLLPILQQRHLDSQASSLLLRASHLPSDSGQTLLRATNEQPSDPSQLLRMAPPEGSEDPNP